MKNILFSLMALMISLPALAGTESDLIKNMPHKETLALEAKLKNAVQKLTPAARNFYVNWKDADCKQAHGLAEDDLLPVGVCMVQFGAFQVLGDAALTISFSGNGDGQTMNYSITVLDMGEE
jgi:hypothetical protein